ncbi:hypothetical protein J6590_030092 [Homalodisca vitripennis]|nr:hypothetical protein J6590_030092 [Homalodisca vitripennis]
MRRVNAKVRRISWTTSPDYTDAKCVVLARLYKRRNRHVASQITLFQVANMDAVQIGAVGFQCLLEMYLEKTKRQDRRWGTHPVLSSRLTTGAFHLMFEKHRQYEDKFYQYYRMSVSSFDELLHLVSDGLMKKDTNMKRSIEPAERLAITIR